MKCCGNSIGGRPAGPCRKISLTSLHLDMYLLGQDIYSWASAFMMAGTFMRQSELDVLRSSLTSCPIISPTLAGRESSEAEKQCGIELMFLPEN